MKNETYVARCHVCGFTRQHDSAPKANASINAHRRRTENESDSQHKGAEIVSLVAHRAELFIVLRQPRAVA